MGLFGGQFANVVEWNAFDDDILFWKWVTVKSSGKASW